MFWTDGWINGWSPVGQSALLDHLCHPSRLKELETALCYPSRLKELEAAEEEVLWLFLVDAVTIAWVVSVCFSSIYAC